MNERSGRSRRGRSAAALTACAAPVGWKRVNRHDLAIEKLLRFLSSFCFKTEVEDFKEPLPGPVCKPLTRLDVPICLFGFSRINKLPRSLEPHSSMVLGLGKFVQDHLHLKLPCLGLPFGSFSLGFHLRKQFGVRFSFVLPFFGFGIGFRYSFGLGLLSFFRGRFIIPFRSENLLHMTVLEPSYHIHLVPMG